MLKILSQIVSFLIACLLHVGLLVLLQLSLRDAAHTVESSAPLLLVNLVEMSEASSDADLVGGAPGGEHIAASAEMPPTVEIQQAATAESESIADEPPIPTAHPELQPEPLTEPEPITEAPVPLETPAQPEPILQPEAQQTLETTPEPAPSAAQQPNELPPAAQSKTPEPQPPRQAQVAEKPARPATDAQQGVAAPQPAPAGGEGAGTTGQLEGEPSLVRSITPVYPIGSRKRNEEGVVTLSVKVTHTGRVASVSVEQSSGYRDLDLAAQRAVNKARFKPAQKNGVAIESITLLTIRFRLQEQ